MSAPTNATGRMLDSFAPYASALCGVNAKDIAVVLAFCRAIASLFSRTTNTTSNALTTEELVVPIAYSVQSIDVGEPVPAELVIDTYSVAPLGQYPAHFAMATVPGPTNADVPAIVRLFSNAPELPLEAPVTLATNSATEKLFFRTPSGKYLPATPEKIKAKTAPLYRKDGRNYRRVDRATLAA